MLPSPYCAWRSHITHGMSDQLSRAADSIPQNVATSKSREARPLNAFQSSETAYSLLDELGKMLTTMIKGNHRDTRSSSTL